MTNKFKSIKTELKLCQKAWAENLNAKLTWCCHHGILLEELTEAAQNRIDYIITDKPKNEQATRLRNFRPVRIELPAEWDKARAEWDKAHAESKDELTLLHNQDWPDNSWNGKNIFPS
jgi:hypothetical protein